MENEVQDNKTKAVNESTNNLTQNLGQNKNNISFDKEKTTAPQALTPNTTTNISSNTNPISENLNRPITTGQNPSSAGGKTEVKEFENLLLELKQELIIEGYSARTLKMYLLYNREILYWVNKPVAQISKRDMMSYLATKKENGCENNTLALIHAAADYMFKKYLKMNILEEIKIPKKGKSLPKVLTKDEIRELFKATKFGRNRLMLQFMYGSGCRVSEVVKLKVSDINFKERTAVIRGGKGNKDRMIILSKDWLKDLKKYLEKKKIKTEEVFSKKNGKNLSTDTVQRIVRDSAETAKINKHVTPHCLRHSYATHLLEAGTNIRYIQSLLGHSNLNTTQIYTNVANEQLKKVESPLDKL